MKEWLFEHPELAVLAGIGGAVILFSILVAPFWIAAAKRISANPAEEAKKDQEEATRWLWV